MRRRMGLAVLVAGLAGLAVPPGLDAQYFGRNKVQYESFDFDVLKTEHFDVYHYKGEAEAAEMAARMAERWYARISRLLDHELRGRQPLILYASHPHFEQTNAVPGQIGESTGGVTEALRRRIVLPFAATLPESDHVLGHELVHAFQFDITQQNPASAGVSGLPTALTLPLWFIEGMAEYLSLGPVDPHTAMWLRDAARECCELPTLRTLGNPKFFPYRFGHAFWAFVGGRWGDEAIGKILKVAGRSGVAEQAIVTVLQTPADSIDAMWHAAIRETYAQVEAQTRPPDAFGRLLISEETGGGEINLGPALSPDGSKVVFLSEKDLFSIEMFLADVETGRIEKRLTKTATDPHFESLQFINSAGAWSPDGRRFAFAGVARGQPVITILDMERGGRKEKELRFRQLGEIFTPTWSPDGRRIAFSAQVGGVTDLYVAEVESGALRRLTDDPYADLHPSWSPDGAAIAFSTDRFSTKLDELAYGNYRLATVDPESGEIQALPVFGNGKHIDPHWSADGGSLYFLTDVSGITNLYRYQFAGGGLYRITDLLTGVSGITALSPALAAASEVDRLVYTVYEEGNYNLYVTDDPEVLRGEPVSGPIAAASPAVLPPEDRGPGLVLPLLRESRLGLADTLTFEREDYRASLGLDFVGQPTLLVGADQFGAFVSGGISLFFSDLLGDHNLATILQVNGGEGDVLRSSAGVLAYSNRRSRWNWGGQVSQIPIIFRRFARGFDQQGFFVEQADRFWQINREVGLGVAYPFNRSQRVEFSGGFRNVDFAAEREIRIFDPVTGQLLDDQTFDLPFDTIPSLNLGQTSAALVFDNSLFGGTGPILGQRYRLQGTGTFGTLNYFTALADYRRYFMPVRKLTLAGRILHFGRYGDDGEDPRLSQLFLGFPSLVRGYNDGSFDIAECDPPPDAPGTCPVFDQLLGSRLAVANVELRLPILGFFGVVPSPGAPPVEVFTFFDAGVAWTSGDEGTFLDSGSSFLGIRRDPVTSFGVGMRVNLFGFLIGELDVVHPNDRPDKGTYVLFHLAPAF